MKWWGWIGMAIVLFGADNVRGQGWDSLPSAILYLGVGVMIWLTARDKSN